MHVPFSLQFNSFSKGFYPFQQSGATQNFLTAVVLEYVFHYWLNISVCLPYHLLLQDMCQKKIIRKGGEVLFIITGPFRLRWPVILLFPHTHECMFPPHSQIELMEDTPKDFPSNRDRTAPCKCSKKTGSLWENKGGAQTWEGKQQQEKLPTKKTKKQAE